jgi:hypothetical protein
VQTAVPALLREATNLLPAAMDLPVVFAVDVVVGGNHQSRMVPSRW